MCFRVMLLFLLHYVWVFSTILHGLLVCPALSVIGQPRANGECEDEFYMERFLVIDGKIDLILVPDTRTSYYLLSQSTAARRWVP
jgi:hypothetical protein